jgi:hypothetical protein
MPISVMLATWTVVSSTYCLCRTPLIIYEGGPISKAQVFVTPCCLQSTSRYRLRTSTGCFKKSTTKVLQTLLCGLCYENFYTWRCTNYLSFKVLCQLLADRGYRVVSATDPYGRNIYFVDHFLDPLTSTATDRRRQILLENGAMFLWEISNFL